MIDALREAADQGVKIDMVIRGICCYAPLSERQREYLDDILSAGGAFIALVDDIIETSTSAATGASVDRDDDDDDVSDPAASRRDLDSDSGVKVKDTALDDAGDTWWFFKCTVL